MSKEPRTNCRKCGAPLGLNTRCEYCGTIEKNEEKDGEIFLYADGEPIGKVITEHRGHRWLRFDYGGGTAM